MMLRTWVLTALVARGPTGVTVAEPPATETTSRFTAVVLDRTIGAAPDLFDELELRLGNGVVVHADAIAQAPSGAFVWVFVDDDAGELRVRLVTHDGREFTRRVASDPDQRLRVAAGVIANMIDAIEHNQLAPERVDVEVPSAAPPPVVAAPAPAAVVRAPRPPVRAPGPAPVRGWIGIRGSGAVTIGVGPPVDVGAFAGGGGGIGLRYVDRRGASIGAMARGQIERRDDVGLARVRVAIAAGYAWRRRWFELVGEVGPTIEVVRLGRAARGAAGVTRTTAPLVGGALVLAPGAIAWEDPRRGSLRVGIELELAYSVEARADAGAVRVLHRTDAGTRAVLRAGGVELGLGLGVEGRFGVLAPQARGRGRARGVAGPGIMSVGSQRDSMRRR